MSSLETEKAAVGDAFTKVEAYSVTRDFSNGVLRQADRSYATIYAANVRDYGKGKGVARSYYAAGVFFDVLGLFETSGVEEAVLEKELIEQRRKYCKWRAALILNAAKKGEDLPVPVAEEEEGGEGDDDAMEEEKEEETKGGETKSGGDEKVRSGDAGLNTCQFLALTHPFPRPRRRRTTLTSRRLPPAGRPSRPPSSSQPPLPPRLQVRSYKEPTLRRISTLTADTSARSQLLPPRPPPASSAGAGSGAAARRARRRRPL